MDHPPATTSGAVPHFYGRCEELAWLYDLFNNVAQSRVPRLAVIVAESGIGKSALVQALYRKLSHDPGWDRESPRGFWPDAFQGSGDELKVNPDFPESYRPGDPPEFMWLGIRWHSPGDRNQVESCPLPRAREDLYRHVKVIQGMGGALAGFRDSLRRKGVELRARGVEETATLAGEVATAVAFGPVVPLAKPFVVAAREVRQGKGARHRDLEEAAKRSAGDELCRELGELRNGGKRLPTILWLDETQWIDPSSIEFLENLFRLAKSGKWPLLVIATHWEREWRVHLRHGSEGAPSLTRFADWEFGENRKTEVRFLEKGDRESLRFRLLEWLPGLTWAQQELIIEKSDGNFLSLDENRRELERTKKNFESEDPTRPLTRAAMKRVEAWEYDRGKRVQQRFEGLEEKTRDILGWSSRAGARFVRRMIGEFAQKRIESAEGRLSMCIDPYLVLWESENRSLMEFRGPAYYQYAMTYFEEFLRASDDDDLQSFIEKWFSGWVNRCFDDNGQTLPPERAPESSLLATSPAERVELLEMAVRFLPLRDAPDWSEPLAPLAAASLRAHCMLVEAYSMERLWDQCRKIGKSLEKIDWMAAPTTVLNLGGREEVCSHLVTAGAFGAAGRLADSLLAVSRARFEEFGTPESRRDVSVALRRLGDIECEQGELDRAHERFSEALEVRRQLLRELRTPESAGDFAHAWENLGAIERECGELNEARKSYSEALEIRRSLDEGWNTPETSEGLFSTLFGLASIEKERGELGRAHKLSSEALEICRRLSEAFGYESWGIAVSLVSLGEIECEQGELDRAHEHYSEALEIHRRSAEERGTPESRSEVSVALCRLGFIEIGRDELDQAHKRFSEALEIRRRCAEELGTPESRRAVAFPIIHLGDIEEERGKLDRANKRYAEALEIHQRLAEELGTPGSREDVAWLLCCVGDIEEGRGELDRAHERFSEALKIRRRCAEEFGTTDSLRKFTDVLCGLVRIEEQRGELDRAHERLSEAAEFYRQQLTEEFGSPDGRWYVAVDLCGFGGIEKLTFGEVRRAHAMFSELLEICRLRAAKLDTLDNRRDVAVSLWGLGGTEWVLGGIEEGFDESDQPHERFSEALEIHRRLADELGTPECHRDISFSLGGLGGVEAERGELDRAHEYVSEALVIRRRCAEEFRTPGSRRDISFSLCSLGGIERQRGELDRAHECFSEALEIYRRLAEEIGTPESRGDVLEMEKKIKAIQTRTATRARLARLRTRRSATPDYGRTRQP